MSGNGVVLIVDDHELLARSLVSLFSASGFDAQAVHSGAEALAFLRGPTAVGALAAGATALGAVAIGRLVIGRASIRRLAIDEIEVRRLRVVELEVVSERRPE